MTTLAVLGNDVLVVWEDRQVKLMKGIKRFPTDPNVEIETLSWDDTECRIIAAVRHRTDRTLAVYEINEDLALQRLSLYARDAVAQRLPNGGLVVTTAAGDDEYSEVWRTGCDIICTF